MSQLFHGTRGVVLSVREETLLLPYPIAAPLAAVSEGAYLVISLSDIAFDPHMAPRTLSP